MYGRLSCSIFGTRSTALPPGSYGMMPVLAEVIANDTGTCSKSECFALLKYVITTGKHKGYKFLQPMKL